MSSVRASLLFVLTILSCYFLSIVSSARILAAFYFPSFSHRVAYQPIWRELSLRGHQVTVITPDPINDPKLINLTEINASNAYDLLKTYRVDRLSPKNTNKREYLENVYKLLETMILIQLENQEFRQLLQDESRNFDLILVEAYHPLLFGLAGRFKAPIIGVSSAGIQLTSYDAVGNPSHPLLNPDIFYEFNNEQMSLFDKICSIFHNVYSRYYFNYVLMPETDKLARIYFGNEIPYLGDLHKQMSLLFLNVNPFLSAIRPIVPAIIEFGQLHIKPPQPLPKDLKEILDDAEHGVVYFSLGSRLKSVNIPENLRNILIETFSQLPYKILWKWESDHLPDCTKNVYVRKWLPQQDILAHTNVKVFVTQGGVQSVEEAISRGVPMVVMPFVSDQPMNARKFAQLGIAINVNPIMVTTHELKEAIITVAQNQSFKRKVLKIRDLLVDQPMTGLEKVVWWSEYVIRHKGAEYLRSPAADMSWYDYYLLDVVGTIILILIVSIYVVYIFVKRILFRSSIKSKTD